MSPAATRTAASAAETAEIAAATAAAIAQGIPGVTDVAAVAKTKRPAPASAVTATFVGTRSADLAIALSDETTLADLSDPATPLVSAADVLRPALEAAGETLGAGVLGEARVDAAPALFRADGALVFALSGAGGAMGWIAVQVKEIAEATAINAGAPADLSRISKVEMELTVEIGRARMSVRDVLGLQPGAVVELDHAVGSPADILLNGRLIGHGDIVVVDQAYAVRVTRILDGAEAGD